MTNYVHRISPDEAHRIQRFVYWAAGITVGFVLLVVIAFLTANSWLTWVSPASEKRFVDPYVELARERLLTPADPVLQKYVEDLAVDLTAPLYSNGSSGVLPEGMTLQFQVIEGDTINAFTTLGGYIFVNASLIEALDSENSLAMVLCHELAHALQRDPLLTAGRGMLIGLLLTSLGGGNMNPATMGDLSSQLMLNAYSREQEQRADLLALSLLQQNYGHVGGATQLFEVIKAASNAAELEMFATHPDLAQRISYLQEEAALKGWLIQPTQAYPEIVRAALR